MLVARTEKVAPTDTDADNLLTVGDVQLHPNLGEPYGRTGTLSFYASIIPEGTPVTASLALAQNTLTLTVNGGLAPVTRSAAFTVQ